MNTNQNNEFEEKRVRALASNYHLQYINLAKSVLSQEILHLLNRQEIEAGLVIFNQEKKFLKIGITHPSSEATQKILNRIKKNYSDKEIILYLISSDSLKHALALYQEKKIKIQKHPYSLAEIQKIIKNPLKILKELSNKELTHIPIDQTLGIILACAGELKASDIHFEPSSSQLILRIRIDGIMQETAKLKNDLFPLFLSRIKVLSGLKINITKEPQDGNFRYIYNNTRIDVRVSTLPGEERENIVMRLLSEELFDLLNIQKIGLHEKDQETIKKILTQTQGIIIISGPTGVGKNTSLYAFLNHIKNSAIKIITLEDPVEYHMEGISQIEIHEKSGLTFAKGLRGVLRQDPDVILLGEIRDGETAEIAFRASETGHLVLSTVHSTSAASSITRLEDLHIRRDTIAANISLLISQRLVRRLCSTCKEAYTPEEDEINLIKDALQNHYLKNQKLTLFKPKGCKKCNHGYKGRIGIFEILEFKENIQIAVEENKTPREIQKIAQEENKMLLMKEDAYLKILTGITTIEEVERVF